MNIFFISILVPFATATTFKEIQWQYGGWKVIPGKCSTCEKGRALFTDLQRDKKSTNNILGRSTSIDEGHSIFASANSPNKVQLVYIPEGSLNDLHSAQLLEIKHKGRRSARSVLFPTISDLAGDLVTDESALSLRHISPRRPTALVAEVGREGEAKQHVELLEAALSGHSDVQEGELPRVFIAPTHLDPPPGYVKIPLISTKNHMKNRSVLPKTFLTSEIHEQLPPGFVQVPLPEKVSHLSHSIPFVNPNNNQHLSTHGGVRNNVGHNSGNIEQARNPIIEINPIKHFSIDQHLTRNQNDQSTFEIRQQFGNVRNINNEKHLQSSHQNELNSQRPRLNEFSFGQNENDQFNSNDFQSNLPGRFEVNDNFQPDFNRDQTRHETDKLFPTELSNNKHFPGGIKAHQNFNFEHKVTQENLPTFHENAANRRPTPLHGQNIRDSRLPNQQDFQDHSSVGNVRGHSSFSDISNQGQNVPRINLQKNEHGQHFQDFGFDSQHFSNDNLTPPLTNTFSGRDHKNGQGFRGRDKKPSPNLQEHEFRGHTQSNISPIASSHFNLNKGNDNFDEVNNFNTNQKEAPIEFSGVKFVKDEVRKHVKDERNFATINKGIPQKSLDVKEPQIFHGVRTKTISELDSGNRFREINNIEVNDPSVKQLHHTEPIPLRNENEQTHNVPQIIPQPLESLSTNTNSFAGVNNIRNFESSSNQPLNNDAGISTFSNLPPQDSLSVAINETPRTPAIQSSRGRVHSRGRHRFSLRPRAQQNEQEIQKTTENKNLSPQTNRNKPRVSLQENGQNVSPNFASKTPSRRRRPQKNIFQTTSTQPTPSTEKSIEGKSSTLFPPFSVAKRIRENPDLSSVRSASGGRKDSSLLRARFGSRLRSKIHEMGDKELSRNSTTVTSQASINKVKQPAVQGRRKVVRVKGGRRRRPTGQRRRRVLSRVKKVNSDVPQNGINTGEIKEDGFLKASGSAQVVVLQHNANKVDFTRSNKSESDIKEAPQLEIRTNLNHPESETRKLTAITTQLPSTTVSSTSKDDVVSSASSERNLGITKEDESALSAQSTGANERVVVTRIQSNTSSKSGEKTQR